MTTLKLQHDGRDWLLSDECSMSSYGEPCLVCDDGAQLRAGEIAYIDSSVPMLGFEHPDGPRPVTAAHVVAHGVKFGTEDAGGKLTPGEYEMVRRFARQVRVPA